MAFYYFLTLIFNFVNFNCAVDVVSLPLPLLAIELFLLLTVLFPTLI